MSYIVLYCLALSFIVLTPKKQRRHKIKIITDKYGSMILIGKADFSIYPSVSIVANQTVYLNTEQVEELITDLQNKLKIMKAQNEQD